MQTENQNRIEFCQGQANHIQSQRYRIQQAIEELQEIDHNLAMQQSRLYEEAARLGFIACNVPEQR